MYAATNSHILVAEFDYEQPATLDEVFSHLAAHGDRARLIAGGTDLLVLMKMERIDPACLISLDRIPELRDVTADDGLTAGSTASIWTLAKSEPVRRRFTALAEACEAFSTVPIMIMGTVGGNLCNASPAADTAPALLVFDAAVDLVSQGERRLVPLEEFFTGPGQTVLRRGEVMLSVRLSEPAPETGSAFLKIGRVAADISLACAAVKLVRDGDQVKDCRIALGAVAPVPMRAPGAEAALSGATFDARSVAEAVRNVEEEVKPITDVRASEEHRRHISGVLVRDALEIAWRRAGREVKQ